MEGDWKKGETIQKTALIIENKLLKLFPIAEILRELGFCFHFAANANSALRKIAENGDIDLVLVNRHEIISDGADYIGEIKKLRPEIPVITVSFSDSIRTKAVIMQETFGESPIGSFKPEELKSEEKGFL